MHSIKMTSEWHEAIAFSTLAREFEDTKEVIRIRISKKNRQHNDELISYNIQYDLLSGTLVFIFYGPIIWWNHQTQEITVNQSIMLLLERTMTTGNTAKVRVKHWITTHWPPPFLKASGCTHWYWSVKDEYKCTWQEIILDVIRY
jgi:hypothetical protein